MDTGYKFIRKINRASGAVEFRPSKERYQEFLRQYAVYSVINGKIAQVGEFDHDRTATDRILLPSPDGKGYVATDIARRSIQTLATYDNCAKVLQKDLCFDAAALNVAGRINDHRGSLKNMLADELIKRNNYIDTTGDEPIGTVVGYTSDIDPKRLAIYGVYEPVMSHAAVIAGTYDGNPLYMSRNVDRPIVLCNEQSMRVEFGPKDGEPIRALDEHVIGRAIYQQLRELFC